MIRPTIEHVVAYPMSGYVNRLQAMASSALLAEDLGADVRYCWVPFALVPGEPGDIFAADFVDDYFITSDEALACLGRPLEDIPIYVGSDPVARIAWLRGHDQGEQGLLPNLMQVLTSEGSLSTLAIVAGGSFGLDDTQKFLERKRTYYTGLALHPAIEGAVARQLDVHPEPFLALHLRYTDRSLQTPSDSAIKRALVASAEESGITSLFIAADNVDAAARWEDFARSLGLDPWSTHPPVLDRTDPRSAHGALIDWCLLGHAHSVVYFSASSFAAEAVCAGGSWTRSIGLHPSPAREAWLRGSALAEAGWRRISRRQR